jgi:hypothetical protein
MRSGVVCALFSCAAMDPALDQTDIAEFLELLTALTAERDASIMESLSLFPSSY